MNGNNNQYVAESNQVQRITGLYDTETKKHQSGSIYNQNEISPTLTTMNKGGNNQPFIIVKEAAKKGYTEAKEGDSINYSYPNSTTKRGRVGKEISQTILSMSSIATVVKPPKPIRLNTNAKLSMQDRIYDTAGISTAITVGNFRSKIAERKVFNPYNQKEIKDIAPTQTTCGNTNSSAAVLISEDGKHVLSIRKLTPLECWRLMGFDDMDFYKAKSIGISDTQLYKQAGNSIVVNVLEAIFANLLKE